MRFIYVGAFRLPDLDAAAPRVLTIGKMLRDCGHSVKYISWGGKYNETSIAGKHYVDGFEYEISNELEIFRNPIFRFKQWLTRGKNSLKRIANTDDYDAVIAYQPGLYFLKKLKSLCNSKGKKLIVDITEWYDNNELRLIDRPIEHYNMTVTIKSVKNKILISNHLANYYFGTNNVVIPATCDLTDEKWSKEPQKKLSAFDGITLIYAGTPALKDKLSIVINVVSRLIKEGRNLRFYVLGVNKDQYYLTRSEELPHSIVFVGRIPQDNVPGYYRQSDFMVLLRDKTRKSMMGFPTKFSEAISSGIPIITTDTSDLSSYLTDGENGFFISQPTEECLYNFLSEKICNLDKDSIAKLKQNAKSRSQELDYRSFTEAINQFVLKLS